MYPLPPSWAPETNSVETARSAVAQLSAEAGLNISIAPNLRDQRVLVLRRGGGAWQILSGLAGALHASLYHTSKGFVLERRASDDSMYLRARTEERMSWLGAKLDSYAKLRARTSNVPADLAPTVLSMLRAEANRVSEIAAGTKYALEPFSSADVLPSANLLVGLLSRMDKKSLASLPAGQAVSFSEPVAAGSVALPKSADLLDTYNRLIPSVASIALSQEEMQSPLAAYVNGVVSRLKTGRLAKRLRLFESANANGMLFSLDIFDVNGSKIDEATVLAQAGGSTLTPQQIARMVAAKDAKPNTIALSVEARLAVDFGFRTVGMSGQSLPSWLDRADQVEPLNLFVKEALIGLASAHPDEPQVFMVRDSLWSTVRSCTIDGTVNLSTLLEVFRRWNPYESRPSLDVMVNASPE